MGARLVGVVDEKKRMLFNSVEFILFFPLVVGLYFAVPTRYRWGLLLAASYYFYASWKAEYLLLIIASTLVDYWAGLQMGRYRSRQKRQPYLLVSLCVNLGILFGFKYLYFFGESTRVIFDQFSLSFDSGLAALMLPVGISFYTFQTLAYSVEVYRGQQRPERHLGIFALYVSFFPQLVAGPIERSKHLLPQFKEHHTFNYERVVSGLQLMLWGFFKKLVIADRLALYVDSVYSFPSAYSGSSLLLATYLFAIQIYCDFSGYSDIAIGAARVMGYDLMENFRRPYFAKSIPEFWRRWHISLSTWFRDYLYIPLGGSRVTKRRWYYNLLVVFLISGLWHGAAWTFVIWGGLHGCYMVASSITREARASLWKGIERWYRIATTPAYRAAGFSVSFPTVRSVISVLATFHLVVFAWIFFRAQSLTQAFVIVKKILAFEPAIPNLAAVSNIDIAVGTIAVALLLTVHLLERREKITRLVSAQPVWIRWPSYLLVALATLLFGVFEQQEFIYFQF